MLPDIRKVVTSLAEVWIEIQMWHRHGLTVEVTSLAEVWIEIFVFHNVTNAPIVTSLAEVWIEISKHFSKCLHPLRHFPCGSVD